MSFSSKHKIFKLQILTERFSARFVIILLLEVMLNMTSGMTIGSKPVVLQELSSDSSGSKLCFIDESQQVHSVSDLLRCMNRWASNIGLQNIVRLVGEKSLSGSQRNNPNNQFTSSYRGRQYNDLKQSYYSGNANALNYEDLIFSLRGQSEYYTSRSEYTSAPTLSEFQSNRGISSNFFKALSSISQYDDLQCVPRILCEATTGVMPGSETYKQTSSFQDLGQNALIGLLTAFDSSESSPLITFAKAAILGYSSRGNPTTCYRNYPKCPRNYDSLVHYLNNHKGGFFRFFGGLTGGYQPFSQTAYSKAESGIINSRIINEDPLLIDGNDTGNKEFKFDVPSVREIDRNSKQSLVFPNDNKNKSELEQIIFPIQGDTDNQGLGNRISKLLNSDFNFSSTYNSTNHRKSVSFFPRE